MKFKDTKSFKKMISKFEEWGSQELAEGLMEFAELEIQEEIHPMDLNNPVNAFKLIDFFSDEDDD